MNANQLARNPSLRGADLSRSRFDRLDALRGAAVVWMVAFHFCFDLNHFRYIRADFYDDPFWTGQRVVIVSLFLFCAGLGQAVAWSQGQGWGRFWKRWAQVAGCALLVSAGSWWVFGSRFISFGVLHGLAVMLLLLRLGLGLHVGGRRSLSTSALLAVCALGAAAIAAPWFWQHPFFDTRLTNWVGLITHKPATQDHVPLLPWIGVLLWGFAAGKWLLARRPHGLSGGLAPGLRPLAWLGRWSLTVYMVHQPLLFGAFIALGWALRG